MVYCKNGLNKSVSVIVAYLIRHTDYNLLQAIKKVRSINPKINIDKTLMYHLYQYEIIVKGESSLDSNDVKVENLKKEIDIDEKKLMEQVTELIQMNKFAELNHLLQISENRTDKHLIILRRCIYFITRDRINQILEMYPDIKTPKFLKIYNFAYETSLAISEHILDELGCKNALRQGIHSILSNNPLFYDECNNYFHLLLTTKKSDQDFDSSLSSIHKSMTYFSKIVNFDNVFKEQYINLLTKRIIKNQFDISRENQLLQSLSMFDVLCEHSNNIISSYSLFMNILQEYKNEHIKKSLILSSIRSIPLIDVSKSVYKYCIDDSNEYMAPILPDRLANEWYNFKEYIDNNYQRKLYVLPQFGDCEMNVNINGKNYTITVNTVMMCILYLFNDIDKNEGLTFNDIKTKTNIHENILKPALHSILKGNYVGSGTRDALILESLIHNSSEPVYILNYNFSSKSKRFKIPMSKI